ncbi:MAG: FkbM family methyltransferase [Terrimonas sp.]|nr:FkbM family methyltransferase [Terrimonas sp.]
MANKTLFFNRLKHFFYRITGFKKTLVALCAPYGYRFKFQLMDAIGRDIYYRYGVYAEDHITQWLLDNLDIRDNDLILDIGANIGWYSVMLSSRSAPRIVAFEPDPTNYGILKENIRMNKKEPVTVFNKAVSDHEGELALHLYKNYNTGRHSFIQQPKSIGTVNVPVIALDDFLPARGFGEGPIKLIKIDIEGYEYTALRKALSTLERASFILTEFTPSMMRSIGQEPMDYIRLLQEAGFVLKVIDEEGISEPDFAKITGEGQQVNLIGARAEFLYKIDKAS